MTRFDVAIAGAGPAGALTALLLARRGLSVALLDRSHFPRAKTCAEYLSPGVADVLSGVGLAPVLDGAHRFPGMDIIAPQAALYRVRYAVEGHGRPAMSLPRRILDARLVAAACGAGATLMEGAVVREPLYRDGRVVGVAGSRGGDDVTIEAALTVVADGARSVMTRRLGLARPPRWPRRLGLVAYHEGTVPSGAGQMIVFPGGYCGVAPLPDGLLNVAAVVPADSMRRRGLSAQALLDATIASVPALRELLAGTRRVGNVRGLVPLGSRASRHSVAGALLVGDAAGFFDPFTGEGIYRALRGAELAADAAVAALERGDLSESQLGAYDRMRREAFRQKEVVTMLVQLFIRFPSLLAYALPRLSTRPSGEILSNVLGDVVPAHEFLALVPLWQALRP
ncbi:MAG TPA: NAD(P)/FAD-dependent oxidoreductase [Chloroflexota bacterium]|nr:NAD(P)/FAD-dependent oxidoreductase [Chloroflexota bacterium]